MDDRKALEFAAKEADRMSDHVKSMLESGVITENGIMIARRMAMDVIHAMHNFRKSSTPKPKETQAEVLASAGL